MHQFSPFSQTYVSTGLPNSISEDLKRLITTILQLKQLNLGFVLYIYLAVASARPSLPLEISEPIRHS